MARSARRSASSLSPSGSGRSRAAPDAGGRAPERRQLSVLFCDLIDSTALSETLDPEDLDELLRAYHHRCVETIETAGGYVAEVKGDGIVAYFGYLQASENDAERAIRAGLALAEDVPAMPTVHGAPLGVRIGIASGLVVAGGMTMTSASIEQGAVGQTLNLAARLQTLAPANGVVVAEATRRLTGTLFTCRDMGRQALKGFSEPVQTWQVTGANAAPSRVRDTAGTAGNGLVGRRAELDALSGAWDDVASGRGRIVALVGEAGIGKSRLLVEFRKRIAATRHAWVEDGGSQFFSGTPFYPVSQMVRRLVDPSGRVSPPRFRTRLAAALRRSDVRPDGALPVLGAMLDLPVGQDALSALPPTGAKRALLFGAIQDWVRGASLRRPLAIVFEDLHWADASSLELLGAIAAIIADLPVLLLVTMRPRTPQRIAPRNRVLTLKLDPLSDAEIQEIVGGADDRGATLTRQERDGIIQRAGGVPLFGIELAHLLREQRNAGGLRGTTGDDPIPASLSDLLMARLDQLGPAKPVAQLASVIGIEVPLSLLQTVSGLPPATLRATIAKLGRQDILQPEDQQGTVFAFRHAMLRDAAYASLLKSRRRLLHRSIAEAISREGASSHPELLAYHWSNAGEMDAAIGAWKLAGDYALDRRAFTEAERAYGAALGALLKQPATAEREQRELGLQGLYAKVLRVTRGLSARETQEATSRAHALASSRGDRDQVLQQAWGAWAAASSGGEFVLGRELAAGFQELAFADGRPGWLATAQMMLMTSRFRVGDILGAEEEFQRGLPHFGEAGFRSRAGYVAQTFGNAAMISWTLDDDAEAARRILGALHPEGPDADPFEVTYGKLMHGVFLDLVGRHAEAEREALDGLDLCARFNIAQFSASTRVVLGRARMGLGAAEDAVALIRQGVEEMRGSAVRVAMTRYVTWLAEALLAAGRVEEAMQAADESLTINAEEFFYRPESLRVRAAIHARAGRMGAALRDLSEGLQLARHMGARRFVRTLGAALQVHSHHHHEQPGADRVGQFYNRSSEMVSI